MGARSSPALSRKTLGWVGSITAIFSLIAGVYGGWTFLSAQFKKQRTTDRLLASEAVQVSKGDYAAAWNALQQAATIESGSAKVERAQEDLAMQWLENIHISGNQTFSEITEKLEPVLIRGATSTKSPQRQADLLAHLGWSYFLRRRESPSAPDPESGYRDALQKDPSNPYAHAMWGQWILWNDGEIAKANEQFTAALASTRPVRTYVRTLQIAAVMNHDSSEFQEETIRVANAIRKEHSDLDPDTRRRILPIYESRLIYGHKTPAFLNALPPAEHLATFDWLTQQTNRLDSGVRSYCRSRLLEAVGRTDEALAGYRAIHAQYPRSLREATLQGIARLTHK